MKLVISKSPGKKVAVISHERSGTHFLMNTIDNNFGEFISEPWWNFDIELAINFHDSCEIKQYFSGVHDLCVLNILKSHYPAEFLHEIIDYFADQFHIFYIYRDPRDVLVSYWKIINSFSWDHGPKTATAGQFLRAEPRGAMLRHQKQQEPNMLQRWRTHVEGWLQLAEEKPECDITVLSYEELNLNYEDTLQKISTKLGISYGTPDRPDTVQRVIGGGKGRVGTYRNYLDGRDMEFVRSEIGDVMDKLGYSL